MRGLFLSQSIEYRLEVTGDSFSQGDTLHCSLIIKSHADSPTILTDLSLILAHGDLKRVKTKDPSAFDPIAPAEIERGCELPARGQLTFPVTIKLDTNAPISDKNHSLYLLYGNSSDINSLGQLLLTVSPHAHLRAIFDTMTTVFNFTPKGETSKDGYVTAKLKAPDSRRLSLVNELSLSGRFVDESLELIFLFSVKKFDTSLTKINVRRGKVEARKMLAPSDYLFGGDFIRPEYIEQIVESAISEVATGI